MNARHTLALAALAAALPAAPLAPLGAQSTNGSLRDQLSSLFIFGPGQSPLFLSGSADPNNPQSIQAHGSHFIPSSSAGNATVIGFLTSAIASSVANAPVSATSGGTTFRFEGGVPVATSVSPGPIFAERALTLGRGRTLVGLSRNTSSFRTFRGVDLSQLHLNFTHQNVDFEGCDATAGGDCSLMGLPILENDIMQFDLALDIDVAVTAFSMTYGLTDRVDVGLVVPLVSTVLSGQSFAQVVPFGGTVAHFFGGTASNPQLQATRVVHGSTTGVGDVGTRVKVNISQTARGGFSLLGEARFPTGSSEDLLGSGRFAARGLAVASARFGVFSPHLNAGYLFRNDSLQNDVVLATGGFDHMLAPWATLAIDVLSELQVGDTKLRVPDPVLIQTPFRREVLPTDIPNARDDIFNASVGFKFIAAPGLAIVTNSLWPLNRGGLRPNVTWTLGAEYNF